MSMKIGILGAGQLGKMLAEAATALGFDTHVYAPDADPIAASASTHYTKGDYTDEKALEKFAASVDIITLEFENVPVEPLYLLDTPICPGPHVLEVSQHRVKEKKFANSLDIETARFVPIAKPAEALALGRPGILKTCRMGYDGKGQWKIDPASPPDLSAVPDGEYIFEDLVDFTMEISVIAARSSKGEVQCFEPVQNVHRNQILYTTTAPAKISLEISEKAMENAIKLVNSLKIIGLLAIEMFVTRDGRVLMNEMAPRPHNSGHWTMDGCNVSQFEQAIRAVTGMPLVAPHRKAQKVVMTNLIGDEVNHLEDWKEKGAHIHLYGKKEIRPGRKMGHVTELFDQ